MRETTTVQSPIEFEAPSAGAWELEATHHGKRPITAFVRALLKDAAEDGTKVLVERYGIPLEGIQLAFVNGCTYMRPKGLGEGAKPKPPPPAIVMKLIARLHPEMRRRNRTAARAWEEKRWRHEVDQWFDRDRKEVVARNFELQAVDLRNLDDATLAAHVAEAAAHFAEQAQLNMETHGGDLMPTGDYLAHCKQWDIPFAEASALLQGSSPATLETAHLLAPAARAIANASQAPSSLADVRALGPDASDVVDAWLQLHGWRLVTSDDIDKPTLAERPRLQLAALLAADADVAEPADVDVSAVRAQVPLTDQALFDELLVEARYGMRQRDDIVGVRWNWAGGLLRRALLEVGRRLTERGQLDDPAHAVELLPEEVEPLLLTKDGPSKTQVAERAEFRDAVEASGPPEMLGEPEMPPPLEALPSPMARATAAMMVVFEAEGLAGEGSTDPLAGTGIGVVPYRGRARVATTADDALDRLEPGDVLIAPFTGPAYNSILPIVGALVVEAGGSMCHAAIAARELGVPAIIGATGASTHIPDGAMVEVDPAAGVVRLV